MISGRGLGHTGGTLDKLDSIPGYDSTPDLDRLRARCQAGCAIVGQTADLAPADRRLYALRDATGTVESIPLIVASILSKKLAEGLDGLVMDIKAGSGAFMPTREQSAELGRAIAEVSEGAGLPCTALLTDMDQVLGRTAGNALEVREAIDVLRDGTGEPRLVEVTLELARAALELVGVDAEVEGGAALGRGGRALRPHGRGARRAERSARRARAPPRRGAGPPRGHRHPASWTAIDVRALGLVGHGQLGRRPPPRDRRHRPRGRPHRRRRPRRGRRLASPTVHARDEQSAAAAEDAVRAAMATGNGPWTPPPPVQRRERPPKPALWPFGRLSFGRPRG